MPDTINHNPPKGSAPKRGTRPEAKPFRLGFLVHDVSRMRRTLFDSQMKPLGITRSQWSVLAWLSRGANEGVTQVDLARQLDVGKVTIGGLIDRLEVSGHVERRLDPADRRARRIFITKKGFVLIRQMQTVGTELNDSILADVSVKDRETTERVLARIKDNLRGLLAEESDTNSE
ncbi:MAG: MarR family transcriptional regulator [Henriciella sp.]|uniref:MarR family winged helix-turn-helix transcriptional regulator n=1 Tax=Henriciella sp. TaxID=1968823 RepID=UPI0032EFD85E